MRRGERLELPDGTSFLVVDAPAENGGERIELEIALQPGAPAPPRHRHPRQTEEWTVVEGELEVLVGARWRTLRAGESATIPPGTTHTLRNRSAETVRVRDVHVPALDFGDYIADLHALARETGSVRPRSFRALARLAAILVEHRTTQVSASPAQRLAESLLARFGRRAR